MYHFLIPNIINVYTNKYRVEFILQLLPKFVYTIDHRTAQNYISKNEKIKSLHILGHIANGKIRGTLV